MHAEVREAVAFPKEKRGVCMLLPHALNCEVTFTSRRIPLMITFLPEYSLAEAGLGTSKGPYLVLFESTASSGLPWGDLTFSSGFPISSPAPIPVSVGPGPELGAGCRDTCLGVCVEGSFTGQVGSCANVLGTVGCDWFWDGSFSVQQ